MKKKNFFSPRMLISVSLTNMTASGFDFSCMKQMWDQVLYTILYRLYNCYLEKTFFAVCISSLQPCRSDESIFTLWYRYCASPQWSVFSHKIITVISWVYSVRCLYLYLALFYPFLFIYDVWFFLFLHMFISICCVLSPSLNSLSVSLFISQDVIWVDIHCMSVFSSLQLSLSSGLPKSSFCWCFSDWVTSLHLYMENTVFLFAWLLVSVIVLATVFIAFTSAI